MTDMTEDSKRDLSETVKPVTARIFGNDLIDFRELLTQWQRQTQDLSIGEGEAINAAILRVVKVATEAGRQEEIERMNIPQEDVPGFNAWCDMYMQGFLYDLETIMRRRDKLDKRKKRY